MAVMKFEKKESSVGRGVRLPKSIDDWLREVAKREGVSENQVVIAALRASMDEDQKKGR